MLKGNGICIHPGITCGRIFVPDTASCAPACAPWDPAAEKAQLQQALQAAKAQLSQLIEETTASLGENNARIFDMQLLMLEDASFLSHIDARIDNGKSAAEAAKEAADGFAAQFAALDDDYMKARCADIQDLSQRLVRILCRARAQAFPDEPFIVAARDLTPSDTVRMPRERILAIVTHSGSITSHAAILARSLGIPALAGCDLPFDRLQGREMLVDCESGSCWVDPDEATKARILSKRQPEKETQPELLIYKDRPAVTKSGRRIGVYANIAFPEEARTALLHGAEGIGLMRSEFLYLGREDAPTEDELFCAYRTVAECMQGRCVIIRTLDAGADKALPYLGLEKEENPALGLRGVRICLANHALFRTQLRAIYRASCYGNLWMMFPLISSVWEVQQVRSLCRQVRQELMHEGIACRDIPLGIMVETPAAALISDALARHADFFSVGTNDLTQYTLAADRQNAALGRYADAHHPAVFRLLAMVAENAHRAHIPVGLCGTLSSDFSVTQQLLQMGFDELSTVPEHILPLKKIICESEVPYEGIPVCDPR